MSKHRLNRDKVIEAAVKMANERGHYESVTLLGLAKELDVKMPSLYNHISGLDDLRQGMAIYGLKILSHQMRTAAMGLIGEEALIAMADAYHEFAHVYPGIYSLAVCAPEADEPTVAALAQDFVQMLMLVFASLGLEGEAAQHAMRGYRAVLHGFLALEAAGGYRLPLSKDESFRSLIQTYLAGLAINSKRL